MSEEITIGDYVIITSVANYYHGSVGKVTKIIKEESSHNILIKIKAIHPSGCASHYYHPWTKLNHIKKFTEIEKQWYIITKGPLE